MSVTFPISYVADSVRVEACSVNPIDTKIRNGTYDDAPGLAHLFSPNQTFKLIEDTDYYRFSPKGFHIIGYDGAGTVVEVGPECRDYKPGDEVYYVVNTISQGTYAEYVLVHELSVGRKPKNLDFLEAASMGLTFGTAYQSLVDRLEIKPKEDAAILIVCLQHFSIGDIRLRFANSLADKRRRWRRKCCYSTSAQPSTTSCGHRHRISTRHY
jgi:threonine dehydrogenase-like Zn-dependent dehydrogenase